MIRDVGCVKRGVEEYGRGEIKCVSENGLVFK